MYWLLKFIVGVLGLGGELSPLFFPVIILSWSDVFGLYSLLNFINEITGNEKST